MNIYIASDHAGFELKQHLIEFLQAKKYSVIDKGPTEYNHDDDYPDYISLVGKEISAHPDDFGIVIGLSGQGEGLVANKLSGVRAGVYYGGPMEIIKLLREHNNAN